MNKQLATIPVPDPTAVLFLLFAASALLWANGIVWAGALLPLSLVGSIFVYGVSKRPDVAVVVLVASAALPRLFVSVGSLKARPEHVIGALLCFAIPLWWISQQRRIKLAIPDYLVMAYIGMNFVSSLFTSIAPGQTIRWAAQQTLAIVPYFILRIAVNTPERFRHAVRAMLVVGALEATYGIVCWFSYLFFGSELGVEPNQYDNIAATYGTQFEANILGAFCGACCVMMLAMYLDKRERKYLWGYAVTLMGMAVSLSRAAAIATAVAILALAWYKDRRKLADNKLILKFVAATLCVFLILAPVLLQSYKERFSTIDVSDITSDPNTLVRAIQLAMAVENILKHPVLGNGTSSFQLLFSGPEMGADVDQQAWIGNAPMRMLHDTGAIGLSLFTIFVLYLALRSWRLVKQGGDSEFIALLGSAIVYCITFQATEGTILAFAWVHLGLLACAVTIYSKRLPGIEPTSAIRPN